MGARNYNPGSTFAADATILGRIVGKPEAIQKRACRRSMAISSKRTYGD
jgi:hypothetical protein